MALPTREELYSAYTDHVRRHGEESARRVVERFGYGSDLDGVPSEVWADVIEALGGAPADTDHIEVNPHGAIDPAAIFAKWNKRGRMP